MALTKNRPVYTGKVVPHPASPAPLIGGAVNTAASNAPLLRDDVMTLLGTLNEIHARLRSAGDKLFAGRLEGNTDPEPQGRGPDTAPQGVPAVADGVRLANVIANRIEVLLERIADAL